MNTPEPIVDPSSGMAALVAGAQALYALHNLKHRARGSRAFWILHRIQVYLAHCQDACSAALFAFHDPEMDYWKQ